MILTPLNRPGLSNGIRICNRVSVVFIVCAIPSTSTVFCKKDTQPRQYQGPTDAVMTPAKKTKPDQPKQPGPTPLPNQ